MKTELNIQVLFDLISHSKSRGFVFQMRDEKTTYVLDKLKIKTAKTNFEPTPIYEFSLSQKNSNIRPEARSNL